MDRAETAGWNAFWAEHGQPWRTEPEIGEDRQAELAARRAIAPDVVRGDFPFAGLTARSRIARLEDNPFDPLLAPLPRIRSAKTITTGTSSEPNRMTMSR